MTRAPKVFNERNTCIAAASFAVLAASPEEAEFLGLVSASWLRKKPATLRNNLFMRQAKISRAISRVKSRSESQRHLTGTCLRYSRAYSTGSSGRLCDFRLL
ncbi:hypothetical protein EYR41_006793 [Orbilia oligospora]|uniref:Uncharacterized protein n=1 Tax=Orbilia oligospora TaxID=2813651 RepID=A0A7C8TX54_ORBOL|nr:hypothetical protein TWF751_000166 [Orbilia oligospora]KAF3246519.1 hypothetical protein TWF128_008970 [Orbilia oligospora]KAF3268973.1 hypothetical protein TWF217_010255 [Orbilia oligospora]TGJ67681.1 hypothetical protein EYR41_006793 [Orbilia oligospora]